MKTPLKLDRPLAFFDIEATGISPRADRIIDLAVVTIHTNGEESTHQWRINPGVPIPPETTAIHGITDDDVKESPLFADVADEIFDIFNPCDLAGYNNTRFDIPMLIEELARANVLFNMEDRRIVDIQRIYHRREPRDLTAALSYFAGEEHTDAHGALPDVIATIKVLEGQFEKYPDLPVSVEELDEYCNPRDPSWADKVGRLKWNNGVLTLNFGKKKGLSIESILNEDSGFIQWILRNDFPEDTKRILKNAIAGNWPEAPVQSDK
jgi:DNA polymerase-3 subunit epsilon